MVVGGELRSWHHRPGSPEVWFQKGILKLMELIVRKQLHNYNTIVFPKELRERYPVAQLPFPGVRFRHWDPNRPLANE